MLDAMPDAPRTPADPSDVELLLELEHEGWQALSTGGDAAAAFYSAQMTPDAVMVLANGAVMARDEVIAALRDAPPWDTYVIERPVAVPIGDRVLALVYEAQGRRGETQFRGILTSVYAQTPDGWMLAMHQQTGTA